MLESKGDEIESIAKFENAYVINPYHFKTCRKLIKNYQDGGQNEKAGSLINTMALLRSRAFSSS